MHLSLLFHASARPAIKDAHMLRMTILIHRPASPLLALFCCSGSHPRLINYKPPKLEVDRSSRVYSTQILIKGSNNPLNRAQGTRLPPISPSGWLMKPILPSAVYVLPVVEMPNDLQFPPFVNTHSIT